MVPSHGDTASGVTSITVQQLPTPFPVKSVTTVISVVTKTSDTGSLPWDCHCLPKSEQRHFLKKKLPL